MRKTPIFLLIGAAALVLAGCRIETNILLEVEEDGSGVFSFEFGMDEEFRDLVGSTGGELGDLNTQLPDIEGSSAYEREEGEMSFSGVRIEFDDIDEINELMKQSSDDFAEFTSFSFDLTEDGAVFDANISSEAPQDLGDLGIDPSALTGDFFSASFMLSMPGTVTEHNADEVLTDGTLRWDLPIFGGASNYHAESSFGGSGFPWLPVLIGLVILLGVIAMVVAVVLGKKQEKQAVSDAAATYPQQAPIAEGQDTPTPEETGSDKPDDDG